MAIIFVIFLKKTILTFHLSRMNENTTLPTLANGHIGYQIFSDTLLLNSLYNGEEGNSHRARIQNFANIQIKDCYVPLESEGAFVTKSGCTYRLKEREGIFETVFEHANYYVRHHSYAHKFYDRAVVNQFYIERRKTGGKLFFINQV